MAKQKGPNKIEGFFDGKIYYKMGNEWYVRNSSAPSSTKVKKDPAFKALRDYSKEFGSASAIGACFKKSLGAVPDTVSDNKLSRRISSLFAKLIHKGKGEQGKRSIEILRNRDLFCGFQFKEEHPFDSAFSAPYSLEVKKKRKEVILTVPAFKGNTGIVKATGATHFRMVLCIVTFSDYEYDVKTKTYLPLEPSANKLCMTEYSELIPIREKIEAFSLKAQLHIKTLLSESVGIVTCLGIEFYEMVGGKPYLLGMKSCMKIADVF